MSRKFSANEVRSMLLDQRRELINRFGSPGNLGEIGQGYNQPSMMYFGEQRCDCDEILFHIFKRPGFVETLQKINDINQFKRVLNAYRNSTKSSFSAYSGI